MGTITRHSSLRESTLASIAEFLYDEGFDNNSVLKEGILSLINLISDYYEEGEHLFPEVIITNNSDELFKTISNREIVICKKKLYLKEFNNAIKLCAPLTSGSWVIYIEVTQEEIKFGLVDAEMTETSPSIKDQLVGSLKVHPANTKVAYLSNIGMKTVELVGLEKTLIVSLNLDQEVTGISNLSSKFSELITLLCDEKFKNGIRTFISKTLEEALTKGHGNLIGIVTDDTDIITTLKETITDAIYLENPIDFEELVTYTENEKTNESSVSLIAYAKIAVAMLNHDGITLISNKGKILGYHAFIEPSAESKDVSGGARSRAFQSMIDSRLFIACLYRSQDGQSKIWVANE